jgi:hypothetical protein
MFTEHYISVFIADSIANTLTIDDLPVDFTRLKKMNDATVRIISDYTPKPKKMLQHSNTAITTLALQEK